MDAEREQDEQWWASMMFRTTKLLNDMGWDAKEFARQAHEDLGVSEKAVTQWFKRKSMPARKIALVAEFLKVDVRYLMLVRGIDSPNADPNGLYALKKTIRDQAEKLAIAEARPGKRQA